MDEKRRKLLLTGAAAVVGRRTWPGTMGVPLALRTAPASSQINLPDRIQFATGPFTLGVASGDPTPDAVVIWTRLAPDPLAPQGGLTAPETVWWGVATDEQFNNLVDLGSVTALPENGGAVHVDVTGLTPDTEYFYAFWNADQVTSVTGRTKTAPSGAVNQARFALISCQSIGAGRYAAFDRMVEEDLDFILHVGDYIYENALPSGSWPVEVNSALTDLDESELLDGYRVRHALYKGDPQLRAAHQVVPWIVTWDDHDFRNGYRKDGPGPNFLQRRAIAYQAYYEHMPIRPPAGPPDPATGFRIYRQLVFGDLLDIMVLDTRQYRDRAPVVCNPFSSNPVNLLNCLNQDLDNPSRTMLGAAQKQWLKDKLDTSIADWRCIANQMLMADAKLQVLGIGVAGHTEAWQGYGAERAEILGHIASNSLEDVVVLSGDWHRSVVSNLKVDFGDLAAPNVAAEFCGMGVTSSAGQNPNTLIESQTFYPLNQHMRWYESEQHGYVVCDVTKQKWTSTYRSVNRSNPSAPATTMAVFEVEKGVPAVNQVAGQNGNPLPPGI